MCTSFPSSWNRQLHGLVDQSKNGPQDWTPVFLAVGRKCLQPSGRFDKPSRLSPLVCPRYEACFPDISTTSRQLQRQDPRVLTASCPVPTDDWDSHRQHSGARDGFMPPKISAGRGWGKHSCPGSRGSPFLGVIQSCGDVRVRLSLRRRMLQANVIYERQRHYGNPYPVQSQ